MTTRLERPRSRFRSPLSWIRRGGLSALVLGLPLLLTFGLFSWLPIGRAALMSFQTTNLISDPVWVGLDNFARVLSDPLLLTAVRNTGYFTLLALVFGYPLPLILAACMNELRRGRGLYSVLAYLPVVVPPVAAILLWRFFYDAGPTGVFNTVLGWFGVGPWAWIQSPDSAMPSLVLVATWSAAGATVIIYLAALSGLRGELYDAAEVDGASIPQKIWHVMLPQLRYVLLVTLILQLIGTFQVFVEPFLLTSGGPANATITVLLLIYRYAFGTGGAGDFGAATTLSLMLAAALALLSWVYLRATRAWSPS